MLFLFCITVFENEKYFETSELVILYFKNKDMSSNYVYLLHKVPHDYKKLIRSYENINEKINKRKWSIKFNNVCLKEKLWPTYTQYTI